MCVVFSNWSPVVQALSQSQTLSPALCVPGAFDGGEREGWHQTMGCGTLVILAELCQLRDTPGSCKSRHLGSCLWLQSAG